MKITRRTKGSGFGKSALSSTARVFGRRSSSSIGSSLTMCQKRSCGSMTVIFVSSPPWLWPITTISRIAGSFPSGSKVWTAWVSASRSRAAEYGIGFPVV